MPNANDETRSERIRPAVDAYHKRIMSLISGANKMLWQFVWMWPPVHDQRRSPPPLYHCVDAEYTAAVMCHHHFQLIEEVSEEALVCFRQARRGQESKWGEYEAVTMHEVATKLLKDLWDVLAESRAPRLDGDTFEEITNRFERLQARDALARTYPECEADSRPDAFPEGAERAGPDWTDFQERFAKNIKKRFRSLIKSEFDRIERQIEAEYADTLALLQGVPIDGRRFTEEETLADEHRKPMTVEEANAKAMKLTDRKKKDLGELSLRKQAKWIGCAFATWKKTESCKVVNAGKTKPQPNASKKPKAQSLTSKLEAVTGIGERDETLHELISQQKVDMEPSPLDIDPPGRDRKVHSGKRL